MALRSDTKRSARYMGLALLPLVATMELSVNLAARGHVMRSASNQREVVILSGPNLSYDGNGDIPPAPTPPPVNPESNATVTAKPFLPADPAETDLAKDGIDEITGSGQVHGRLQLFAPNSGDLLLEYRFQTAVRCAIAEFAQVDCEDTSAQFRNPVDETRENRITVDFIVTVESDKMHETENALRYVDPSALNLKIANNMELQKMDTVALRDLTLQVGAPGNRTEEELSHTM
mmetsp:Transcript_43385/g.68700  ORF Transcript_43385/g.68700 Transcript_43385/m.68700 type:complete len:233 (+) Transcript_43385:74-772(+)